VSLLIALTIVGVSFTISTKRPAPILQTAKIVEAPMQVADSAIDLALSATTKTAKSDISRTVTEERSAPIPIILPQAQPDAQPADESNDAIAVDIPRLDETQSASSHADVELDAAEPVITPHPVEEREAPKAVPPSAATEEEPAVAMIAAPPVSSQLAMEKVEFVPDVVKPVIAPRPVEKPHISKIASLSAATEDEPAVAKIVPPPVSSRLAMAAPRPVEKPEVSKTAALSTATENDPTVAIIVPPPAPDTSSQMALVEITTSSPLLKREKRVAPLNRIKSFPATGRRAENGGWQTYMAHVVSTRSKAEARVALNRIRANHKKLVRGLSTRIASSNASGVTVYTAGFGPLPTHKAAARLCEELLATGEGDCVVWPPWSLKQ
jgi:hypothetical protein